MAIRDASTGTVFVTRSTATSATEIEIDGVTYPLITVDVTSDSHPLWTGRQRVVDTAGRVQRFEEKYRRFGGLTARR
ncbi:type B 50S ribosomal protein L31 [Tsukamurella soli]|uniref:50S ribosomal protein L31 n=1 Tax=Tsukamurella soli TaxID=644556 RepID=A0ABP8KDZ9_9ACTN